MRLSIPTLARYAGMLGTAAALCAFGALRADDVKEATDAAGDATRSVQGTADQATDRASDAARDTSRAAKNRTGDATRDVQRSTNRAAQSAQPDRINRNADRSTNRLQRDARGTSRTDVRTGTSRQDRDLRSRGNETDRQGRTAVEANRRDLDRASQDINRGARGTVNRGAARVERDTRINDRTQVDVRARGRVGARAKGNVGVTFSNRDNRIAVSNVNRGGLGASLGLRQGDVIVSVNSRPLRSDADFERWVYTPGVERVPIVVLRDGRQMTLYATPDMYEGSQVAYDQPQSGGASLGVDLDASYPDQAVIRQVRPNSPAEQADLRPGDAILSVDGEQITSPDHLVQVIGSHNPGDEVALEVGFGDQVQKVAVVLAGRGATAAAPPAPAYDVRTRTDVAVPPPAPSRIQGGAIVQPGGEAGVIVQPGGQTRIDVNVDANRKRGGAIRGRNRNK